MRHRWGSYAAGATRSTARHAGAAPTHRAQLLVLTTARVAFVATCWVGNRASALQRQQRALRAGAAAPRLRPSSHARTAAARRTLYTGRRPRHPHHVSQCRPQQERAGRLVRRYVHPAPTPAARRRQRLCGWLGPIFGGGGFGRGGGLGLCTCRGGVRERILRHGTRACTPTHRGPRHAQPVHPPPLPPPPSSPSTAPPVCSAVRTCARRARLAGPTPPSAAPPLPGAGRKTQANVENGTDAEGAPLLPGGDGGGGGGAKAPKAKGLNTFNGVFVPCVLTIMGGVFLFLRLGFVIGQVRAARARRANDLAGCCLRGARPGEPHGRGGCGGCGGRDATPPRNRPPPPPPDLAIKLAFVRHLAVAIPAHGRTTCACPRPS